MERMRRPRILITLGDVAGIGPEIVLRSWPELLRWCVPTVVGDAVTLRRQAEHFGLRRQIQVVDSPAASCGETVIPCLQGTAQDLQNVRFGQVDPAAGRAAYDFVCRAVSAVLSGQADAIVTAPLHKEALALAGLPYPGHTELLAELCGVSRYAMMLFARRAADCAPQPGSGDHPSWDEAVPRLAGWGVAHVTLHQRLRDVFDRITIPAVLEKIELLGGLLRQLLGREPRLAVCGLNPHASDGGLFGDEEERVLQPAVAQAQTRGWQVTGPWPADTLFSRAARGEIDGVVAMYHDQGHIPFKLLAGFRAVNITLGLPLIRTSVAHGTAYDIAGRGCADTTSLIEAVLVAAHLVRVRQGSHEPPDGVFSSPSAALAVSLAQPRLPE